MNGSGALLLFAILQKYDFSSKSQPKANNVLLNACCLRYCKSTIFQANHNANALKYLSSYVVCDTAKVRFFKQITTVINGIDICVELFAILQKYDFSSKSQHAKEHGILMCSCLRYCKSTIFQANHNPHTMVCDGVLLFAILQKYDFSSKSQLMKCLPYVRRSCLRYCKSTIFQANHNAKTSVENVLKLFAILQKYDFSSKSQPIISVRSACNCCLRYCKSTIFQANHNPLAQDVQAAVGCLRYCKSTIFQANHNW